MHSFADNAGRTWTLSITLGSVERAKGLVGADLLRLEEGEPPLLTRLGTDVALLCDVIFALVKPQADQQGVTDEQWAEAMGGDAILAAQTAFYEELVSFFRNLGRRDVVAAAATQKRMIDLVIQANEDRIARVDPEKEIASIYAEPPASSPASAASSPGRSP